MALKAKPFLQLAVKSFSLTTCSYLHRNIKCFQDLSQEERVLSCKRKSGGGVERGGEGKAWGRALTNGLVSWHFWR